MAETRTGHSAGRKAWTVTDGAGNPLSVLLYHPPSQAEQWDIFDSAVLEDGSKPKGYVPLVRFEGYL